MANGNGVAGGAEVAILKGGGDERMRRNGMRYRLGPILAVLVVVALLGAGFGLQPRSGAVSAQGEASTPAAGGGTLEGIEVGERGVSSGLERAAAEAGNAGLERAAAQGDNAGGHSAGIYSGSCAELGDDAEHALRDLALQDAGEGATSVETSFTTVDVPMEDLSADAFAVAVRNEGNDVVACGELGQGDAGNSRYVGVREQDGSGYAGIAWLYAKGDQTQVSLFLAQGLTEGGGNNNSGGDDPPAPPEETVEPGPPTEEPAEPTAAATRTGSGGGDSYTSENYGYTVSWSRAWTPTVQETKEDSSGNPVDQLFLNNKRSYVYFFGHTADIDPQSCVDNVAGNASQGENVSDWQPRLGDDGEPLAGSEGDMSFAVFDYTLATESGTDLPVSEYIMCRTITPGRQILVFFQDTLQQTYEAESEAREELLANLQMPGE